MGKGDRNKKKQDDYEDEEVDSSPVNTQVEVCRSFSGIKIPQFNGSNFSSWKMRIVAVLEEHDLDDVILSSSSTVDRKREKRCRALLKLHLADNILCLMDGKSSTEIWKSLCSTYERSGAQLRVHRWHKLCSLRFDEKKEKLGSFITQFETCAQQLKATGVKLEEIDVVSLFLYTLQNCYDSIVDALQTLSEERMTMEMVKNRLLNFELKRADKAKIETVIDDGTARAFVAKASSHDNYGPAVECEKCG